MFSIFDAICYQVATPLRGLPPAFDAFRRLSPPSSTPPFDDVTRRHFDAFHDAAITLFFALMLLLLDAADYADARAKSYYVSLISRQALIALLRARFATMALRCFCCHVLRYFHAFAADAAIFFFSIFFFRCRHFSSRRFAIAAMPFFFFSPFAITLMMFAALRRFLLIE